MAEWVNVYATLKLRPLAFIACDLWPWRPNYTSIHFAFLLHENIHFEPKGLPLLCLFVPFEFTAFCSFIFFWVRSCCFSFRTELMITKTERNSLKVLTIAITICHFVGRVETRMWHDSIALIRWGFSAMHIGRAKSHENFDTVSSKVAQTSNEYSSLGELQNNQTLDTKHRKKNRQKVNNNDNNEAHMPNYSLRILCCFDYNTASSMANSNGNVNGDRLEIHMIRYGMQWNAPKKSTAIRSGAGLLPMVSVGGMPGTVFFHIKQFVCECACDSQNHSKFKRSHCKIY